MNDYRVTESETGNYAEARGDKGAFWFMKMTKFHDRGAIQLPGDLEKDMKRSLTNFCEGLVEEHEEALAALLQAKPRQQPRGVNGQGDEEAYRTPATHVEFCSKTTKHCKD